MSLVLPPYEPPPGLEGRWLAIVPGVVLSAVLSLALVLGLRASSLPPEGTPILAGAWANAFEKQLDDAIETRSVGLPLFGALEYFLFGTGRKGVVVGQNGWLFSAEELEQHPQEGQTQTAHLLLVQAVDRALKARGIALRVAFLPSKARVYAEALGDLRLPDIPAKRYGAFRAGLEAAGVAVPELLTPLREAARTTQVFLRTDTHWTPAGAWVVAETLANGLTFAEKGSTSYVRQALTAEPHAGDLLKFLPLGPWTAYGPSPDVVEGFRAVAPVAPDALLGETLLGDVRIPVVLVGTSYSKASRWGFADALRLSLGAEVLNVAQEGQGPFVPMLAWMAHPSFREAPPSVVIWELPERYVGAPGALDAYADQLTQLGLGG